MRERFFRKSFPHFAIYKVMFPVQKHEAAMELTENRKTPGLPERGRRGNSGMRKPAETAFAGAGKEYQNEFSALRY